MVSLFWKSFLYSRAFCSLDPFTEGKKIAKGLNVEERRIKKKKKKETYYIKLIFHCENMKHWHHSFIVFYNISLSSLYLFHTFFLSPSFSLSLPPIP